MTLTIPNPVQYSIWINLSECELRKDARFHPEEEIESLAKSMEVKQLQPVIVCRLPSPPAPLPPEGEGARRAGEGYEVLAGVGRVLAARKLGWQQIRADIYENLTEIQKLDMIFSENEDRHNASPLYQAQILKGMMEADKLTQEQLADRIGKDPTTVSKYLSLCRLSPRIWQNMNRFVKLGLRHFMQLLRIENEEDQWKVAESTADKGLSVDQLEGVVNNLLGVKKGAKKMGRPKGAQTSKEGFNFKRKGSKIRMVADFEESVDMDSLLPQLKNAWVSWREAHPQKSKGAKVVAPKISREAMSAILKMNQLRGGMDPRFAALVMRFRPANAEEGKRMAKEMERPRLPQNAQEEAELMAQSEAGGLAGFYGWLYGKDGAMASKVQCVTWQDAGFKDAAEGAGVILDMTRKMEATRASPGRL